MNKFHKMYVFKLTIACCLVGFFSFSGNAQTMDSSLNNWPYNCIHIPKHISAEKLTKPVVVAVIDDAFRLTHKEIKDFIYTNPLEIANNQLDDDGNGFVDDVHGWDISDNDNNATVPEGREKDFFHGTFLASIILKTAKFTFGTDASNRIKIMPVKAISDQASSFYIRDGYKGIKYAMELGADIICIAWSGGNPGSEEINIIQEANKKGVLLIGAAGNLNQEILSYPAHFPEVLAVAGINDQLQKSDMSNYGMKVDISAPATKVKGAHPVKDNAYFTDDGTSAAAALVVGCAAVLKATKNEINNELINSALINTSTPFDENFKYYGGKMGAGIVNLKNALDYVSNPANRINHFSSYRSKGTMLFTSQNAIDKLQIKPVGAYQGFYLEPDISKLKKPEKNTLNITVDDTLWASYSLSKTPEQVFVPSSSISVSLTGVSLKKNDLLKIKYAGKPIDSTTLFCDGIKYISMNSGIINDGSGESNYSNNCSCKWIITVPAEKRIKFTFDELDTEPSTDYIYLVDGETVIPENIIAKISGENKPPVLTSRTNKVLIWFVTNKSVTRKGWQISYKTVLK